MTELQQTTPPMPQKTASERRTPLLFQTPATALLFLASAALSLTLSFHPRGNTREILTVFGWADASLLWQGDLWRLWVSNLLHNNIFHFLFNAYWLLRLGPPAEKILGRRAYLAGLLLAAWSIGVVGSFSWEAGGIGLSGLIYFLFGFLWRCKDRERRAAAVCDAPTCAIMWIWLLLIGPGLALFGLLKVGNIAHLTGIGCGLLLAEGYRRWSTVRDHQLQIAAALTLVLLLLVPASLYLKQPLLNADWHYWKAYNSRLPQQQIEHYQSALALDAENQRVRYNLGLAYYQNGRLEKAEQIWLGCAADRQVSQALFALYANQGNAEQMARWAARLQPSGNRAE